MLSASPEPAPEAPELTVVVPARNEAERLPYCLASLGAQQGVRISVLVSDNGSTDDTAQVLATFAGELPLIVRRVEPLGPSAHFASAVRWALASTSTETFALLAGDDTWSDGFGAAAVSLLAARPEVDVVFPTFVWEGAGPERVLRPMSFLSPSPALRQLRAVMLPDARELSNLVYGVYRRAAFADLAEAWAVGGDEYGADFAAVWSVIGHHRVAACPAAVGRRSVRVGADLVERIGFHRTGEEGPLAMARMFVRLSVATNSELAAALRRVGTRRNRPRSSVVQLLRAPQAAWGAGVALRGLLAGRQAGSAGGGP